MNLWTKVKFKEEKNAYHLLRSFFNEFDPRSSIVIRGREAEVKIYFENQPPMASVEAISGCCVDEFVFNGEMLQGRNEEYPSEQTETDAAAEKISEQGEQPVASENTEETTAIKEENSVGAEEGSHPKRVKMACMPEIPLFEEALGSIDKTQPIEDRVEYVLRAMGWNELNPQEKEEVFEITNLAVRLKKMRLPMVRFLMYEWTSIPPMYDWNEAVSVISTFVNKYVGNYAPGKEVNVEVFLKNLQKVMLDESEIQSFEDFTKSIRK